VPVLDFLLLLGPADALLGLIDGRFVRRGLCGGGCTEIS
jgi:hypothetical protein